MFKTKNSSSALKRKEQTIIEAGLQENRSEKMIEKLNAAWHGKCESVLVAKSID